MDIFGGHDSDSHTFLYISSDLHDIYLFDDLVSNGGPRRISSEEVK